MLSAGTAASCVSSAFKSLARADLGLAVGQAKDKVAETDLSVRMRRKSPSNVGERFCRKPKPCVVGALHELGAAGLQHDGHIGHDVADHARQLEAGFGRELAAAGKLHVRHDRQQVLAIHDRLSLAASS